ncbi:class I SAM-dependent methyltransferase [Streptomyces sp. NPDC060223]|uniref:class I SAM-dependent methyltransferase n=1 Tax=unclassified Streptomyces TaxID=2593676 RepID=UPI0036426D41
MSTGADTSPDPRADPPPPGTDGPGRPPAVREVVTGGAVIRVLVDDGAPEDVPSPAPASAPVLWPSIGEYPIYDPTSYRVLATDEERNSRFRTALSRLAPGRTVLDLGTGQELVWAREALRAGARHVVAMEEMPASYAGALDNLRALGLEREITLLNGASGALESGSRAEVCIAEVIGSLAGAEGAAAVLTDARRRHLVPGGTIVPERAVTLAAPACLRGLLGGRTPAFSPAGVTYLQRIFDWNGAPFDVRLRIRDPAVDAVLSPGEPVEVLDFNGDLLVGQHRAAHLVIDRPGPVDGILTWLELRCLPDGEPLDALAVKSSWASVYLPLFDSEIPVAPGDTIDLAFTTTLSDDGLHPNYRVEAILRTADGVIRTGAHHSPHHGTTFRDRPLYRTLFPQPALPPDPRPPALNTPATRRD